MPTPASCSVATPPARDAAPPRRRTRRLEPPACAAGGACTSELLAADPQGRQVVSAVRPMGLYASRRVIDGRTADDKDGTAEQWPVGSPLAVPPLSSGLG